MINNQVAIFLKKSIDYLQNDQQKNGSFLSFSSPNPDNFKDAIVFHTIFSNTLILSCLNQLDHSPQIDKIKSKLATFLLSQKSKYWSFNYWEKGTDEAKQMPYPDDLDDTFCALSALYKHDPSLIDGQVLANVVAILTNLETKEGGPYKTWLVSENADLVWRDVDVAVNSNVAYFLSLIEIDIPQLTKFIETKIKSNNIKSPYYPTIFSIIYFISRFYKGKYKNNLIKILIDKKNNFHWDNPLDTALSLCALSNFGLNLADFSKSIDYLINTDIHQPYPFYTGVNPKKDKLFYAGSNSLTTAFCLEAVQKYLNSTIHTKNNTDVLKSDRDILLIHREIIKHTKQNFFNLPEQSLNNALKLIETITNKDTKKQITLTPYYFKLALGKNGKSISNQQLVTLGEANLLGWIAYTIYDDFLDDEGDPKKLPIANIALRKLTSIFDQFLPEKTGFKEFFHYIMDNLETANAWEVLNTRFKFDKRHNNLRKLHLPNWDNYSHLFNRSLGHALGSLSLLFYIGYPENSNEIQNLKKFFQYYLIAKQLNDDAHDWQKDLEKGHLNPVVTQLLIKLKAKKFKNKQNISFEYLSKKLQEIFWYEVIVDVSKEILENVNQAKKALSKISCIQNPNILENLLVRVEKSARLAIDEQKNTLKFLETYQYKNT